jgi:predicted nucleotidyltransferase
MAADTVAAIDARLDGIVTHDRVSIPLAIESGSRAWGFPSPDSDYDCRFVYVRRPEAYLTPWQPRDVIETPLEGDLDVNGWDLGKALKLMLNGNAVIVEWLQSPITYRDDETFRAEFLALSQRLADRSRLARHYLSFAQQLVHRHLSDPEQVVRKKLFYVLRPAAALRWLRAHPDEALPPMHFPTLMAQSDVPDGVTRLVERMLAEKAVTRELGAGPMPSAIAEFFEAEIEAGRAAFSDETPRVSRAEHKAEAAAFFRLWAERLAA